MSNVVSFPKANKRHYINNPDFGTIRGQVVRKPKTAQQFLDLCKDQLDVDVYMDVLCSIMDKEHYDAMDDKVQRLTDIYRTFKS